MPHKNRFYQIITILTLTVAVIMVFPAAVYATSVSVSPAAVTVGLGNTASANIVATNSGTNAADVVVTFNSAILQPVSINAGPNMSGSFNASASGSTFSITVFKGSNFAEGEVIAVVTFRGNSMGSTILDPSGTSFADGLDSATSGQVTVGVSSLPATGLLDNPVQVVIGGAGIAVILLGILLYYRGRRERLARNSSGAQVDSSVSSAK